MSDFNKLLLENFLLSKVEEMQVEILKNKHLIYS